MARLQWTQVAPPDYANAIAGLGSAGKAFNDGMQGISAAIGANKERQGQQISNDILLDMANIYREDQIPDFVNNIRAKYGDKLNNLSPEVQKYLADPRQIIIQNEQRRAFAEGTKLNNLDKSNDMSYTQGQRQQNAQANTLLTQATFAEENGDPLEAQRLRDAANATVTYTAGNGFTRPTGNNATGGNPTSSGGNSSNGGSIVTSADGNQYNTNELGMNRQNAPDIMAVLKSKNVLEEVNRAATNPDEANIGYNAAEIAKNAGITSEGGINAIAAMIMRTKQNIAARKGNAASNFGEITPIITENPTIPNSIGNNFVQAINGTNQNVPVIGTDQAQISVAGQNTPVNNNNAFVPTNNSNVSKNFLNALTNGSVVSNPNQVISTDNTNSDTQTEVEAKPESTQTGIRDTSSFSNLVRNNPTALSQTLEDQKAEADAIYQTNGMGNFYDAYIDSKAGKNKYDAKVNDVATILRNQGDGELSAKDATGFIDSTINSFTNEIQQNLEADENFKGKVDKSFIKNYLLQTIQPESWFRARGMFPNGRFSNLQESGKIVDDLKNFFGSGQVQTLAKAERLAANRKLAEDNYYPKFKEAEASYIALSQENPINKDALETRNKGLALAQQNMFKYGKAYSDAMNDYSRGISTLSGIDNNAKPSGKVKSEDSTNPDKKILDEQVINTIPAGNPNASKIIKDVNTETKDLNNMLSSFDKILSSRRDTATKALTPEVLNKLSENEREAVIDNATYNNDDIKDEGWIFNTSREDIGNRVRQNLLMNLQNDYSVNEITGQPKKSIALKNPSVKRFYDEISKMSGKEVMSNAPQLRKRLVDIINDAGGRTEATMSRYK